MKKLQTRLALILGVVLFTATLLPLLLFYVLSVSGLVEATYVSELHETDLADSNLQWLLDAPLQKAEDMTLETGRIGANVWGGEGDLPVPLEGRIDIVRGPELGRIHFELPVNPGVVALDSQTFKFRVDLPAWLALGSLSLFGLLLGILLSVFLSRSITRPVSRLVDAAQAIEHRQLGYRVKIQGSKELLDLARSFNSMAEELERSEAIRRNLTADVAHELRTPLTVLEGNLRALLDGVRKLDETEIVQLYEQTCHLNHLVDDLRELSLAEAGQLPLHLQPVDLTALSREAVLDFKDIARHNKIRLSAEIQDGLQHPALDPHRVRQVLHNLLSNAIKHTRSRGAIKLIAQKDMKTNAIALSVTDNGEGIAAADLENIFTRFYRARESRSRDQGGSGLGLAIVKAVVEAQSGKVTASSPGIGRGSVFTISIPCPSPNDHP
ncbi:MAG: HAMP domain-containing protein [Anaerolineaceae bacterium]|nr:HAMP domain-containing protein [Anaerolineaceae bacterium]